MRNGILTALVLGAGSTFAFAESGSASTSSRSSFVKEQAYEEMMRVGEQVDVVQANVEALSDRLGRLEGGKGEIAAIKSEIESLRADIASVRREMGRMREEITRDLTKKIVDISKTMRPSPPPQDRAPVYTGAVKEYRVIKGDTLSLIAQAFGTTVQKLREINSLKTDVLQVGQRILVPRN